MNRNVKRATVVLALAPLMSVPAAALAATTAPATQLSKVTAATGIAPTATPAGTGRTGGTTTVTSHTDAPTATASAAAARVDGIVTIGSTSTTAGSGSGSAQADALDLLGNRVQGGDTTDGAKSGSLVATGDIPLGDLELAPWSASVAHAGGGTQSRAEAALVHAGLLGVLQLWVLHSQSQATWTPDASHGQASSDGAEANVGDGAVDVKVLHAETDSNGSGSSALLVLNGTGIGTSDQTNGACKLALDPIAELLCLQASGGQGGNGATTETAYVAGVTGAVPGATVTGASSGGGHVAAPAQARAGRTPARHNANGPLPHTTGPSESRLPFTGVEVGLLTAYGAALAGLGAALLAVGRRARKAAVRG